MNNIYLKVTEQFINWKKHYKEYILPEVNFDVQHELHKHILVIGGFYWEHIIDVFIHLGESLRDIYNKQD